MPISAKSNWRRFHKGMHPNHCTWRGRFQRWPLSAYEPKPTKMLIVGLQSSCDRSAFPLHDNTLKLQYTQSHLSDPCGQL
eukprot:6430600-Amphidinium_carterae.2